MSGSDAGGSRFITRVKLRNYKSIAACDVALEPLTFLVGPNGAGKSNFMDALRFVADALRNSLDHALRDRGGIGEVRRRSSGHPNHFGVRLDFKLDGEIGHYAFQIAAKQSDYEVQTEECSLGSSWVKVKGGAAEGSEPLLPAGSPDRLYLVAASGLPRLRPVYDALSHLTFYNPNPDQARALQRPDPGDQLARDGSNLSSMLKRMARSRPEIKSRIEDYLARVVPGIEGVDAKDVGHMETLEFRQRVAGAEKAWRFQAINMSDGTLRTLGVLIALFQDNGGKGKFVGLEEPEVALHPAAAGLLRDCLRDASRDSQILVTSHSPDLLDDADVPTDAIRAVVADAGRTEIAALDPAGREMLFRRLYTAGELLRLDQLKPDPDEIARVHRQLDLFGDSPQ